MKDKRQGENSVSKAVRMTKASAKRGFSLFLGQVPSTAIKIVGLIAMVRLLTPS